MQNIFDLKYEDLEKFLIKINEKKYRAKQIYEWLYLHKIFTYHDMSNLSKDLVQKFNQNLSNNFIEIKTIQKGEKASKYLFALGDGNLIEAVLMKHDYGNSLCISSQVGCDMGCAFCESGCLKKVRNLKTYEMVQQVLLVGANVDSRIDSVVIMGIGEPLDNYDAVMNFIRIINSSYGLAIGARHITLSTCGLIPGINRLALEDLQFNLAVSLHAPFDELRNRLMPVNKAYNIALLMQTLKAYLAKTNRRITIEYVMLMNVNDSMMHAGELARLLKGMNVYVNLIPYNETSHLGFKKSTQEQIRHFYEILKKAQIDVTIRKAYGLGIDAACGQLRAKEVSE